MAGPRSERARHRARDLPATIHPYAKVRRLRELASDYAERRDAVAESEELISAALDAVARDYFKRALLRARVAPNSLRQAYRRLASGRRALARSCRRRRVSRPPQFNFLGYGRDRVTDLVDDRFQRVSRNCKSPGPGTNLDWICQADLIANGRVFDALHGGVPWLGINGMQRPSFQLVCTRPPIRKEPPELRLDFHRSPLVRQAGSLRFAHTDARESGAFIKSA
jgi:hypothetical protein